MSTAFTFARIYLVSFVVFPSADSGSLANEERIVVNPHNFRYVLNNPHLCSSAGPDLYMLIWIHTAPLHFKHRNFIRETWGNPMNFHDFKIRTVFFMGEPGLETVQNVLNFEFEKYGDIIEEDFRDTYRNLTYKAIMGMKWVDTYCNDVQVILKADDDVVIDVSKLVRHVKALHDRGIGTERAMMCKLVTRAPVFRRGKWAVTNQEYPGKIYPPYCAGMAVLMTPDLIRPLYLESQYTPYFWVDDVYFTGILAEKVKVTHYDLSAVTAAYLLKPDAYLNVDSDYVFVHIHDWNMYYLIWNRMKQLRLTAIS